MKILVACEFSGRVRDAFRRGGHEAWSCDIIEADKSEFSEYHIVGDVTSLLEEGNLNGWDMVIAFPPCTYLCSSGARWMYHPEDKNLPLEERRRHPKHPDRDILKKEAIDFFMMFANCGVEKIAIENPIGFMTNEYRKPDQIIEPYMFGEPYTKKTCLWLKGLPKLVPTKIVYPGILLPTINNKRIPAWISDLNKKGRVKKRSITFKGIANAMAGQWG